MVGNGANNLPLRAFGGVSIINYTLLERVRSMRNALPLVRIVMWYVEQLKNKASDTNETIPILRASYHSIPQSKKKRK